MNELSRLKGPEGSTRPRKRVGRGTSSGKGKTSTRGHKGQKARSGGGISPAFEGGQMPLHRRLPKRGFSNYRQKLNYVAVNVRELARFEDGATVDIEALKRVGLAKGHDVYVKITGTGDLDKKLTVKVSRISEKGVKLERTKQARRAERVIVTKTAAAKITAAGGEVEVDA
jgi:large subunit ribosomal protein L15